MRAQPWIIVQDATKGVDAYAMECLRCGEKQRFVTPMIVDMYVAAGKVFTKQHSQCKERTPAPEEQVTSAREREKC